ncbi:hypothetical protein [Fodinicurvata sp. EGI_FJ10296]|uniref:hypothetical protein n=1 Tax=Fodinicurvata sp. EGI_FJ10296 TaxID=3231908 RepID=UPI00345739D0
MREHSVPRIVLLALCCIVGAVGAVLSPLAAGAQDLRSWDHGDYGRAVFEWGQPVDHRLDQSGRTVDITFSEPVSAEFDSVPQSLSNYVASISQIGLETVRFTLTGDADATAFGTGTAVILDIRPSDGDGQSSDSASSGAGLAFMAPAAVNPGSAISSNAGGIGLPAREPGDASGDASAIPSSRSAGDQTSASGSRQSAASSSQVPTSQEDPPRILSPEPSPEPSPELGQTVGLRGGVHEAFDRLVFDWQQPTAFSVHQDGQRARISFERPGSLNRSGFSENALSRLESAAAVGSGAGGGLVVDLGLSPGTRVDSFSIDNRAVIDLRDGEPRQDDLPALDSGDGRTLAAASTSDRQQPPSEGQPIETRSDNGRPDNAPPDGANPNGSEVDDGPATVEGNPFRPRPSPPRPPRVVAESGDGDVDLGRNLSGDDFSSDPGSDAAEDSATSADPGASAARAPDETSQVAEDQGTIPERPSAPLTGRSDSETPSPGTVRAASEIDEDDLPSLEDVSSSVEDTLARLDAGRQARSRSNRSDDGASILPTDSARSGYGTVPREALEVRTIDAPDGRTVEFDPGVPSYAAFFLRNDALWAVFASRNRLNVSDLARDSEPVLGAPQTVEATGGVALRFADANARGLYVRRDATAWTVTLLDQHRSAEVPITLLRQPNHPAGSRVLAMAPGARGVVRLRDPEIGDVLLVAPVSQAGIGMPTTREFAQLEFLKAEMGIAVRPKADDILMSLTPDGVELTADTGLVLSPDVDTRLAAASRPGDGVPRFYDFANWTTPERAYNTQRRELERRVVESQDDEKASVRMELARLSLTHALPHEALGMLEIAADLDPDLGDEPDFLALRGAARALAGELDGAASDLDHDAFVNAAEGYAWRGLVEERRGNYDGAARAYSRAGDVWADYPDDLQIELRMSAALATLKSGDIDGGHRLANDLLDDYGELVSDTGAFQYLTGLIAKERGDGDRAVAWFGEAVDSNDRKHSVLAERELVALQSEREEIDPQDAADRLEQLRFAWRGDHLELDLLEDLGTAYWRDGAVRQALATWDDARNQFADLPAASDLTDHLRSRFVQVFIGEEGPASALDPIARYSIYEDFSHLMPPGELGRDIRLALAEGLAQIDLLARSAAMLEDMLADGLPADEIPDVATRLAGLRLLDNRVEDALDATDLALDTDPAPETAARARALRARALSEIDRPNEAFAAIAQDDGDLADAARLDIAWRARNWPRAAEALWSLIDRAEIDGDALNTEWRNRIMNLTLVLALSDDQAGLDEVSERFGDQLADGPEGEAFRVLTRSGGSMDTLDLQSIRDEVAEVALFESFLDGFRQSGTAGTADAATPMN